MRVYYDRDADVNLVKSKKVAIAAEHNRKNRRETTGDDALDRRKPPRRQDQELSDWKAGIDVTIGVGPEFNGSQGIDFRANSRARVCRTCTCGRAGFA